MGNALGMIELSSIARGIETCDYMVKAAQVDLVRASTVCPGKYIIIIGGDTADVRASHDRRDLKLGPYVVDTLLIPNINEQVIPAISMTNQVTDRDAIGILEFTPSPLLSRLPMWLPKLPMLP